MRTAHLLTAAGAALLLSACGSGEAPKAEKAAEKPKTILPGEYSYTSEVTKLASTDKSTPSTALKMGAKGLQIPVFPDVPYVDAVYEPLWAWAAEAGTPLCMHRTSGGNDPAGMATFNYKVPGLNVAGSVIRFFAGVDPLSVHDIQRIARHLADRGIGVLITDHNVRETLGICSRAYIVNQGTVLASGSADEILANADVRKVYLGQDFRL